LGKKQGQRWGDGDEAVDPSRIGSSVESEVLSVEMGLHF